VRSFNAETAKPRIQAYEKLEDITSIIACQEKKLCLSYAICSYSMELDDSLAFFDCSFKSGNSNKNLHNFFEHFISLSARLCSFCKK
jgi:hypothetical protein